MKKIVTLAVTAVILAMSAQSALASSTELVQNGSFETGNLQSWTNVAGSSPYIWIYDSAALATNGITPQSGNYVAAFGAYPNAPAVIAQTIDTAVGNAYNFSFWALESGTPGSLSANWNGTTVVSLANIANAWQQYSFTEIASSNSTTISFSGTNLPLWTALDNVSVTEVAAVPEPETMAMLLAGLGLVGLLRVAGNSNFLLNPVQSDRCHSDPLRRVCSFWGAVMVD